MRLRIAIVATTMLVATLVWSQSTSRFRIVPQTSDGLLMDIEESLDGTRLLTHDRGFAPRLWDAKRQILLQVLSGHKDPIFIVNFSHDGKKVITVSQSLIQIWDSNRAKVVNEFHATNGREFSSAAFTPDSSTLAIGFTDGAVAVSTGLNPSVIDVLGRHSQSVSNVIWSPSGKQILSLGIDGTCNLWNIDTQSQISLKAHSNNVPWGSFSRDGQLVLTSGMDNVSMIHESVSGKLVGKYDNYVGDRSVSNVQMGAQFIGIDGELIVCAGEQGDLNIYKPGLSKPKAVMRGHKGEIREIRRSKDGRYLATYAGDQTLRLWDTIELKEIPFNPEEGNPTAGEFSPNSTVWWLGYSNGEVRKYDINTGKATRSTYGAVTTLAFGELASDQVLWLRSKHEGGFGGGLPAQHLFLRPEGGANSITFSWDWNDFTFSPNGRFMVFTPNGVDTGMTLVDILQDKMPLRLKENNIGYFSPDSAYLVSMHEDGSVIAWNSATGDPVWDVTWKVNPEDGPLSGLAFHPNGTWVVTGNHPGNAIVLWDPELKETQTIYDPFKDLIYQLKYTPDAKYLIAHGWQSIVIYDAKYGEELYRSNKKENEDWFPYLTMSATGERIAISNNQSSHVLTIPNLEEVFTIDSSARKSVLSKDGTKLLAALGTKATLWNVDTKKAILELPCIDEITSIQFSNNETRILTIDGVGGATVWEVPSNIDEITSTPLIANSLAKVVLMKSGDWLVYDDKGRFDASDPSNISGAYFVLEWEGGLEAITMPQLKAQFYEPGLLAKALGIDKDPMRDVPNLDSVRLYPDLSVKSSSKPGVIDIECNARDGGGIGRLTVSINGKQVLTKKSSSYLQFNVSDFYSFLLPSTRLVEGASNILSVTVSNEKGDLVSEAIDYDLGIPADLKTPDIKIHALFVGVGDYAGVSSDLTSPPSDARAMAQAIREVSERLLPGRTNVTVLTTGSGINELQPTRDRINKWFNQVATTSTSSDIIFVFFAGHGVSRIGEQSGYFFLTSEADPGNVNPATIGTAAFSADDLREALSAIPANKQIVILDTCSSGAAASSLLDNARSVSGEYQRAWEAIKDSTGTWLLAGSAADQRSYESGNVEHGMLTYALLEAIDRATSVGLRETPSGELFVDVERWLSYAAERVESLKTEVGLKGVQKPEFRRSTKGKSFDVGVMPIEKRGFLALTAPKPIVIVGAFELEQEDPLGLEEAVQVSIRDAKTIKPWFDVQKHPNVFRIAGTYTIEGDNVTVKVFIQKFDSAQVRKTIETIEVTGATTALSTLASKITAVVESRLKALTEKKESADPSKIVVSDKAS